MLIPLIAAGAGAGLGLLGRNNNRTVTTTQGFDPLTEQMRKDVYSGVNAAVGGSSVRPMPPELLAMQGRVPAGMWAQIQQRWAADPKNQVTTQGSVTGLDPDTQKALGLFGGYADAGRRGVEAFTGGDASSFMNPYQSGVIDQIRGQFGLLNDMAQNSVKSQFTQAGAFGGSRQGVAAGQAAADVANNLGNQIAGYQYQGFNDAMGRALASANLGFGAGQQLSSLGPYAQIMNDPNLRRAYLLRQMSAGLPVGTTTTAPNPNYQSPAQAMLGGAISGYGLLGGFGGGGGVPAGSTYNWGGGRPA